MSKVWRIFAVFATIIKATYSLEFLEVSDHIMLGTISQVDTANIVRANEGGCGQLSKKLDCVVPLNKLEVTKTQLVAKGLKFKDADFYGTIAVKYESIGNPEVILRACSTAFLNYIDKKIENHLSQLNDEACMNAPDDCGIKPTESCDKDGDCISFAKIALNKKGMISAPDLQTLNTFNQLLANAGNKKNISNLTPAFQKLQSALQGDSVSSSPKCGVTVSQCLKYVVVRNPNINDFDTVTNYSQGDVKKVFESC